MVEERCQDCHCRENIGVVEAAEEEKQRKKTDVERRVVRVTRDVTAMFAWRKKTLDGVPAQQCEICQEDEANHVGGTQAFGCARIPFRKA